MMATYKDKGLEVGLIGGAYGNRELPKVREEFYFLRVVT